MKFITKIKPFHVDDRDITCRDCGSIAKKGLKVVKGQSPYKLFLML